MTQLTTAALRQIVLPSDQNASGRSFGPEELELLRAVLESGTLTCTKGTMVKTVQERFAEMVGTRHAFACASGTAAIHCAVAALNPDPGDEIVTTGITDMGAITPIIFQGAIPVFADVDPYTANVTGKTIEAVLSERTRAIIVTHLFGNPCGMDEIMALADARGIPVIEDAAQAFLATHDGRQVGSIGAVGCFSLQQGKHITTGEGGFVVTNDDDLARRMRLFIDKAWGYGDARPDHYFAALNYRMTELQGAVALAQLDKLAPGIERRQASAKRLTAKLTGLEGIEPPSAAPGAEHVYWRYCPMIDSNVVADGPMGLAAGLKDCNIASAPRYIQKPAFECEVLRDQRTFGNSRWPFTLARPQAVDYGRDRFPGTYKALDRILVLPWNEQYTDKHVDHLAEAIHTQHDELTRQSRDAG